MSNIDQDPVALGILPHDDAYNAVLAARIDDTDTLARVWIKPTGTPTPFEPGQYVTIGVKVGEKWLQRPYSIASSARDLSGGYELYLRLVRGGAFTPLVFALPVGHALRVLSPKGKFTLQPDDERIHLFISSGTGIAPFVSMARTLLADGRPRRAIYLNGVSYVSDIGYAELLNGWNTSGEYPATYVPTISRPNDPANAGWTGRTGRVETILQSALKDLSVDPAGAVAYLCGNPEMIVAAEGELRAYGLPDEAIHKELYWPAGKQPTGANGTTAATGVSEPTE
jgi:ferredoxin--NADP+ reductase